MASVDGELVTVLLISHGNIVKQQSVNFAVADAIFLDLPPDNYTVIARHPSLNPTEARQDVILTGSTMLGVKFFYTEAARLLLRVELDARRLNV